MAKISKKALEAKKITGDQSQDITNAIKLLKKASYEKFDPTFSASIDLNIDPRKADQQMRGSIILPHGTGKVVKVLAIVESGDIATAKKAGADYAETIDIMKKVEGEN
jgi:large subunit ribosomal protein L1